MNASLFVVIVNWSLKYDTETCILSLLHAGVDLSQIIIVDNGSSDDSAPYLKRIFGNKLTIISLQENVGYALACNIGIRYAQNANAEWILLLNNDTLVSKDYFKNFSQAIEDNPNCSVIAPIIFYVDKPEIIWYLGDHFWGNTLLTKNNYRGKITQNVRRKYIPIDFISGCAVFVRSKAFHDIGLFDSSLFMYGEEIDWCFRAHLKGYSFIAARNLKMWHKVSASSNKVSARTQYLRNRNQIICYRRYGFFLQHFFLFFFTIIKNIILNIKAIIHNQYFETRSTWFGWFDGWFKPIPNPNYYNCLQEDLRWKR